MRQPSGRQSSSTGQDTGIRAYRKTPGRGGPGGEERRGTRLRGSSTPGSGDSRSHHDRRLDRRLDDFGARGGPGDVAGLHHEALLEGSIDSRLDVEGFFAHDFGNLRNDERLGPIEHPFLPEDRKSVV